MKDLMSRLAGNSNPEKDDSYDAKMQVLHELRDMAMNMMGSKMKGHVDPQDEGLNHLESQGPDKSGMYKPEEKHGSPAPFKASEGSQGPSSEDSDMKKASNHVSDLEDLDSHEPEDDLNVEELTALINRLEQKKSKKSSEA